MALHLVFPALRPIAPLSDDLFFFLFPPHLTQLDLGCVSFIQKRPSVFPNLIQESGLDRCKWITMFTLYRIALCTYRNGDFGAISVTEPPCSTHWLCAVNWKLFHQIRCACGTVQFNGLVRDQRTLENPYLLPPQRFRPEDEIPRRHSSNSRVY